MAMDSNNSAVVNTVGKYYYLARTDSKSPLTFLRCNGGSGNENNNNNNKQIVEPIIVMDH